MSTRGKSLRPCTKNLQKKEVDSKSDKIEVDGQIKCRCIPCNKVFNCRQSLYKHNIKFHTVGDPNVTCEFCGKILANLVTYRRHKNKSCAKYKK